MTTEIQKLLINAKDEITRLRSSNQHMSARLDMFDKMMLLFTSSPAYPGASFSPDVVYDIEKALAAESKKETDIVH